MEVAHNELLEAFETFEVDLEVNEILKQVKADLAVFGNDEDIREFGEALLEERRQRRQLAQAAQAARHTYVQEHWNPGCYPQLNTAWYIRGLDFCCDYWRYEFKRPETPPPAPPPSPEVSRKRGPPPQQPTTHDVPTKQRRRRRR